MERVWPCRAELQLNVRREKTPRHERDIDARASLRGASVPRFLFKRDRPRSHVPENTGASQTDDGHY
jgi:hypothetical protein